MSNQLTFRNTVFTSVNHANDIWLTAPELAKALQYKKTDAITQIYERNSDEFSTAMTLTLNLSVNGINNSLRKKVVRVFSLRGAHLVAMFSKTSVAKEFRKWVLDILDREVEKEATEVKTKPRLSTASQLTPLRQTAERLITTGLGKIYPDIWKLVHEHFEVKHIYQLSPAQITEAVEFLNVLEGEYIPRNETESSELAHDEIMRLEKAVSLFNSGYELWRKNIFLNLINMDVPLSGHINAMLKDSLALLRDLNKRISDRTSSNLQN
nr:BRO family protein [Xenorhabdus sp. GDc328]